MGCMGTFYSGLKVNNLDLAPNYAGVIMAITNGVGGINGILAPYIVGVLTPNVSRSFASTEAFLFLHSTFPSSH